MPHRRTNMLDALQEVYSTISERKITKYEDCRGILDNLLFIGWVKGRFSKDEKECLLYEDVSLTRRGIEVLKKWQGSGMKTSRKPNDISQ